MISGYIIMFLASLKHIHFRMESGVLHTMKTHGVSDSTLANSVEDLCFSWSEGVSSKEKNSSKQHGHIVKLIYR